MSPRTEKKAPARSAAASALANLRSLHLPPAPATTPEDRASTQSHNRTIAQTHNFGAATEGVRDGAPTSEAPDVADLAPTAGPRPAAAPTVACSEFRLEARPAEAPPQGGRREARAMDGGVGADPATAAGDVAAPIRTSSNVTLGTANWTWLDAQDRRRRARGGRALGYAGMIRGIVSGLEAAGVDLSAARDEAGLEQLVRDLVCVQAGGR